MSGLPAAAAAAKSLQSCPTLCDSIDSSPPGSAVPGILQARTLEWCHFLLQCMKVKSENEVPQSCLTLRNPTDCSLPGFSVHGIFQAKVLEWGTITFSVALTRWTFVGKVMSLLFNTLSRLVITFLPRIKHLLISWLQSPPAVILEPPK